MKLEGSQILVGNLDYISWEKWGTFQGFEPANGHIRLQKGWMSCSVENGLERLKLEAVRLVRKILLEVAVEGGEKWINLRDMSPVKTPGIRDWKVGVRHEAESQMIFSSVPRSKCHLVYYIWTTEDERFSESCLHPEATREQAPYCVHHISIFLFSLSHACVILKL